MAVVKELIRLDEGNKLCFGDYSLSEKKKLEDFSFGGDLLKVKTFNEITRLEKNGLFLYESVPGTAVHNFTENENGLSFDVEGEDDAQITVGLEEDTEYHVSVSGQESGVIKTNLGGKLSFSVELAGCGTVNVTISK